MQWQPVFALPSFNVMLNSRTENGRVQHSKMETGAISLELLSMKVSNQNDARILHTVASYRS